VTVEGHQTCPHCRAIVQTSICTICGKSSFEEVAATIEPVRQKWWTKLENNEFRRLGVTLLTLALITGGIFIVATRPTSPTVANQLPPPAATTGDPGTAREVEAVDSAEPTAPPIDFVTGLWLDEGLDFSADIARVDDLLAVFPTTWELDELDPPELLTFDGPLDVALIEASQPFAARTIRAGQDAMRVGELWLIASAGDTAGDAYLDAARDRWNSSAAIDQFSPEVGMRLWRLGGDSTLDIWAADLEDRSMVIIQTPVTIAPILLTDSIKAWRRAIDAGQ
jgi:hypothetical protein